MNIVILTEELNVKIICILVCFMVFNTTFINNISAISWQSVLLVEENGENHWPVASHYQLYHIMLYQVHLAWAGFELNTSVVIGTNCIGSCKSNYHITTMTAPYVFWWSMQIYMTYKTKTTLILFNVLLIFAQQSSFPK
jgi:hypothetical protein